MDQAETVDAVYVDFAKVFDTVLHMHLMTKQERYGVTGKRTDMNMTVSGWQTAASWRSWILFSINVKKT